MSFVLAQYTLGRGMPGRCLFALRSRYFRIVTACWRQSSVGTFIAISNATVSSLDIVTFSYFL